VKWEYIVSYLGSVEADNEAEAEIKAVDSHELGARIVAVQVDRKD
jgi:hypothetical protein